MDVVAIFHQVYQQIPQSHLVLVGDGPDRAKAEQYCRDSGICHAITFVGSLPSVEEVLAGADLFLLPSETESFGLAALEALSCEVPVIATAVGGIPEVVQHGVHGYLHPVGAVDEMAKSAIELLTNDALLHQFGKEGRRWAIEQFSQDRIVAQYREIYQRVLA